MTISSIGYDGSIAEGPWARFAPTLGAHYGVVGADDWKVTAKPGATHTVLIAPGDGYGDGVLDSSDNQEEVAISPGPSGTQWYVIYAHRDWGDNETTFTYDDATSTGDLPTDFFTAQDPGTVTNQPIALVQLVEGQTQPAQIIDLRAWQANGGAYARSDKVLQYLTQPGTTVTIGTTTYTRTVTVEGAEAWQTSGTPANIFAVGAALSGGATPTDLSFFKVQFGTYVATSGPTGYAEMTLPTAFPNGLATAVVVNGDDLAPVAASIAQLPSTRTKLAWGLRNSAGARLGGVTHRVNWIAFGW